MLNHLHCCVVVLQLPASLASILKPHQWQGIRFLWHNLVTEYQVAEAASQLPESSQSAFEMEDGALEDKGGCILAHSMGLGKSLQTIALLHMFFSEYE